MTLYVLIETAILISTMSVLYLLWYLISVGRGRLSGESTAED